MYKEALDVFDFKEKDIKVFFDLLENGPSTVGLLAKRLSFSRPSVYGFLRNLKDKGFVLESKKDQVKLFFPNTLEKIQIIYLSKIKKLEKASQEIKKIYKEKLTNNQPVSLPKVEFYDTSQNLKEALLSMLLYRNIKTKAYWPIRSMVDLLSEDFFDLFNQERIKQQIYIQAIWPKSQKLEISKYPYLGFGEEFLREIRIAPETIFFSMGYWIFENKVIFISSKKELFGFMIESRELVEMMESQFEIIWQISKKYNKS